MDFKLKVLGYPEPSVVWYHNGCMVGPDYATEISKDGGLTLVAVEMNHEGICLPITAMTHGCVGAHTLPLN